MIRRRTAVTLAGGVLTALAAAGCQHGKPIYIQATDPVISVCQQPVVASINNDDELVDNANNYNGRGSAMSASDMKGLKADSASLDKLAAGVLTLHPHFANALLNEARDFATAAGSSNGMTTNTIATAADGYTSQIDSDCSNFTVGTAPKPAAAVKPGPGIWDWQLFFEVTLGYLVMLFISSYLIAISERSRPKRTRLEPYQIFWLAVIWPVGLVIKAGEIWSQVLLAASKTDEEKSDERENALAEKNRRLEEKLAKANADLLKAQEPLQ